MYYAHQHAGQRKQRRQAILLIVVSALFVAAGAFMVTSGESGPGWLAIVFFSGCLLAGIAQWRGSRQTGSGGAGSGGAGSGGVLLIAGAYLFGAACLGILTAQWLGLEWVRTYRISGMPLTVVAAIGTVFFGGGAVLLTVKNLRKQRRSGTG